MALLKKFIVAILTLEARIVLRRHHSRVIAVTGSVGKTGTKDAIYEALSSRMHVRKSEKSLNSEMGVPLAILGLRSAWRDPLVWLQNIVQGAYIALFSRGYPRYLVLEVGADRPGDIRAIAKWLRPDIAVLTHVPEVPVHVEFFDSPEAVVREKRSLVEYVKPGGVVVVNGDDARLKTALEGYHGRVITYGLGEHNDFRAQECVVSYEGDTAAGMRFLLVHGGEHASVLLRGALGMPRVYMALAACAVGRELRVSPQDVAKALAAWVPPPGRMRVLEGVSGSTLIDDTYNSSPAAALSALDTLRDLRATRRIAVLGDMLELGKYSADAHREVGTRAAACADMLIVVGIRSRDTVQAALDAGMKDEQVRAYELGEAARAGEELRAELRRGDVVLVKGSQAMRMERAVIALMAHPEQAADLLVRQDAQWKNR